MAEDKSVRVVVKINPSRHPELFEALEEIESSGRAERLRSLALMALSGYNTSTDGSQLAPRTRKSEKAKSQRGGKGKAEEGRSMGGQDTGESSSDGAVADKTPLEEREDPHKDVRTSVLQGMKNAGF
jgi:hypothetical protein